MIQSESPSISIDNAGVVEGNAGTTSASFTVTLTPASSQTVTVDYATADGTAVAGSDYTATSGQLTFNPGETSETIIVNVNGDLLNEANEFFFINLSNATNATISDPQGVGTIFTDDALPGLSINDVSVIEGDTNTTDAVFTVSLAQPSGQTVTVECTTANGTAIADSDYNSNFGLLTFDPGETSKTITVKIVGDTIEEPNETYFVNISNAVNAFIFDSQGTGTIIDDDADGSSDLSIAIEGTPGSVAAGERVTYKITVSNTGPDVARGVVVNTSTPAETTFASTNAAEESMTPQPGEIGPAALSLGSIPSGSSASVEIIFNVFAASGSTLANTATVTSATADANQANNQANATTTVEGGGLLELFWEQPPSTSENPAPAPVNVQVRPTAGISTGSLSTGVVFAPGQTGSHTLVQINIYKSQQPQVQTSPANLWKSVPPGLLSAVMSTAPSGSHYVLTGIWESEGVRVESLPSNEVNVPAGPIIRSIEASSKLKVIGTGFMQGVEVFFDGIGFVKPAKVKKNNTKAVQKGALTDGRRIADALAPGTEVLISFRNGNGGISSIRFIR